MDMGSEREITRGEDNLDANSANRGILVPALDLTGDGSSA